mmetsp:Transcript_66419/g.168288  ORF Transcript_66419/g.168288 Transcript_66419/m.168288 type:complete len:231 (-) Transcript_66419:31-723(-)
MGAVAGAACSEPVLHSASGETASSRLSSPCASSSSSSSPRDRDSSAAEEAFSAATAASPGGAGRPVRLRQVAELRRQLAVEAAAEAAAISAAAVLREELVAAEADAQEEHDRHELLHPEVLEREGRALELAHALDAHRRASVELRANVANLKEDIGKLCKEHGWARRYMGQAEARRARLQTEVQEAEGGLATQQAHGRVARMTHCVAHSSDLRSQLEAHQASEAHEAVCI